MRTFEQILQGMQNTGTDPIPEPWPELAPVFLALARLGSDANGRILHSERTNWLDENQVRQPEEREIFHHLFDVADAESAAARSELMEERLPDRG